MYYRHFRKLLLFIILLLACPYVFSIGNGLKTEYSVSRRVYAEGNKLLRMTLSNDEKYRIWLAYEEIPQSIIQALLIKEDRYFYAHPGFNPVAILKVLWEGAKSGGLQRGGSTLTMQLARIHYQIHSRNFKGKLLQILAAWWLELRLSKNEILEAYLNLAPYGRNIEGIATASQIYFHKELTELTLPEILLLMVMPQQPAQLSQHRKFNALSAELKFRRDLLYEMWIKKHPQDRRWQEAFKLVPYAHSMETIPFLAPHFSQQILDSHEGDLFRTGLDLELQKILEDKITTFVARQTGQGIENAAAMILDYQSMEVKALVGSADFFNSDISGQVNGTDAKRSPGSTLKPFAYALAFEQGLLHPQSLVMDLPLGFRTPENFDEKYLGPITAEKALILSRNAPAVGISVRIRDPDLYDLLKKAEISQMRSKDHYGHSIVIGGLELTLQELLKLYAALANQGELYPLRWLKNDPHQIKRKLMSPAAAAMTLSILEKTPMPSFSGGQNFIHSESSVFWKTGTSYGFRDAWSVGIVGNFVIATWVGNFSGKASPALIGGTAAGPLFFQLIDAVKGKIKDGSHYRNPADFGLEKVTICSLSGKIPGPHCPHHASTWFMPGISPIQSCDIHRILKIAKKTQLRACDQSLGPQQEQVFEVWPTHVLEAFKKIGIPRKTPPAYGAECLIDDKQSIGNQPLILSPKFGLHYTLRMEAKNDPIRLQARTDSDVQFIYWYVNEKLLGKANPQSDFFWQAEPGRHELRVVDDRGRSASRRLRVNLVQ